jgi:hypothetical protein
MSALGHKQTSAVHKRMSALPPESRHQSGLKVPTTCYPSAGNDISPRWASTDAKINSVSPGNGAPSDSNARISETANTP